MGVTSSSGIQTTFDIPAAVETRGPSPRGFLGYSIIGFLVGVVPVALGLGWLPSLRRADARWVAAFMALTAGLLSFLAFDAFAEALGLQAKLPGGFQGTGLILLGIAASYLGLTFVSQRLSVAANASGARHSRAWPWPRSSPSGSGSTTSARDSRSARRSHSVSSRSERS